ncbi:hypothetical protein SMC26_39520 [Actinomadura fulvescens]|uniref:DUF1330 domain-containing protein n=1 Tax=Actinomadura fulvescens TaxID=46160 RepID=A0ABN3Q1Q5_9ACTN
MKLWLVTRVQPAYWDEYQGFVIRAVSRSAALAAAAERSKEHERMWSVKPLRVAGEPGVILSDFNAG